MLGVRGFDGLGCWLWEQFAKPISKSQKNVVNAIYMYV
jgi:hypothetical protein